MKSVFPEILSYFLLAYPLLGALFALLFLARWVKPFDSAAHTGTWGFKLLIIPGLIVLWPIMLCKVWQNHRGQYQVPLPDQDVPAKTLRKSHGWAFLTIGIVVPIAMGIALKVRPSNEFKPMERSALPSLTPAAFPIMLANNLTSNLPFAIDTQLRQEGEEKALQVDIYVEKDLNRPALAVYWSMVPEAKELPKDSVFLGTLWGPHLNRYVLPRSSYHPSILGTLYFLPLASDQDLVGTISLGKR